MIFLLWPVISFAQSSKPAFRLVPLGVLGGVDESNLSAYMLAPTHDDNYICLDAGTINYGIQKAINNKAFTMPVNEVQKKLIKAYFISHGHLDHLAGMIINSPEDTAKYVYGLNTTIGTLKTHYFTWQSWANFADEGEVPKLNKYHYQILKPGEKIDIANTSMQVQAFPLSHSNLTSTAFLVQSKGSYLLYLGDTGADRMERSENMHQLWQAVAPLVRSKALKAIMIEVSFPDEQPDKSLFGHLTPRLLMQEMAELQTLAGVPLKGLNVVITHLKPPYNKIARIKEQLHERNKLQLRIMYPQQGRALNF
ncbi:MBL fold metallo-hydrolase [Mucilaginibacter litoreus]|uniref:MBL fold metallo-hydrolase n=1 Tax=Mucilaginibacter litoreus TaxID=1048221 RepID=UPI00366CEA0B